MNARSEVQDRKAAQQHIAAVVVDDYNHHARIVNGRYAFACCRDHGLPAGEGLSMIAISSSPRQGLMAIARISTICATRPAILSRMERGAFTSNRPYRRIA